jgi:hypothetical protein
MVMIKRFDLETDAPEQEGQEPYSYMQERETGEYVRFDDFIKAINLLTDGDPKVFQAVLEQL